MPRLLITSAGSTAAQNLARWLTTFEDFWILGVDMLADHSGQGLYHAEDVVPRGDDPGYVDRLAALCRRYQIDVLIPVMEPELLACSGATNELEQHGTHLLCAPESCISLCASKRALHARLAELGVQVPKERELASAPLPCFVRPDRGTGSRGARAVRSEAERSVALTEPGLVATELLRGRELSVDGFAYPPGHLVHAIQRTREDVRGGLAVRSCVVPLGGLREVVSTLCAGLGLQGFFNAQYIDTDNHRRAFFDVNPRLGGAMVLSFHAGLRADAYLRAIAKGAKPPEDNAERVGLTLIRRWENLIVEPS